AAFLEEMAKSSRDAQALEDILIRPGLDAKAASALMARLTQQCRDCHALYRD
ncbi:MAG: cytochrome c, partial [Phycisphaerales bacterium]|nr:cytochrome c [Phycisphaerales bacterium]